MVSREQDRIIFRELFDAYFRNPEMAQKLLSQLLPSAEGKAEPSKRRPRVREALSPQNAFGQQAKPKQEDQKVEFDAVMTASSMDRLKHADFNSLSGSEYRLVERLARDVRLPLPHFASRRMHPAGIGARIHWPGVMHQASQTGGELVRLPRLARREQALPSLILVDVSGSMDQATKETLNVASGLPQPLAESMLFGLGISQWANRPQNQSTFNQPEFIKAYNGLFGPNQNQIGRNDGQNNNGLNNNGINNNNNGINNNNLKAALTELIQRLGNN